MNAFQQMINQPVTMDLHVKSILHPQNGSIRGFGAFSGIDSSGNIIHCSGFFPGLSAGMPVRVNGTYQVYKGRISEAGYLQIRADGFHILNFSSEEEIAQYLSGLNVSGCGPKTIEKIIAEYGLDTIREITGGPGTGKSFITKIIYEAAEEAGFCCMAAAPTGRAARRLDSAIFGYCEIDDDFRPKTLHRLLRASDHEGDFRMNSGNRLPYDLLIIDESSMIDIDLAHALLSAVSPRTRIVFIGDENQLPPVGPGNFFADMIASECISVTRLTQIFRQNSGSGIIINAERINSGEFPFCAGRLGLKDDDFFFFECGSEAEITRILSGIPGELSVQYGIDPVRDVQVLTPVNIGSSGTGKLNLLLRERLNPKKAHADDYAIGNMTFRSGDKVMQTANDYSLMVYNGDIGYISSIEHEIISVFYPDYGRTVAYTRSQARHLTLAYAVTIHKAQGAETEAAVIVMDRSNAGNAVRKQFYTAVTRARKAVVLIGERVAFQNALSNRKAVSRNTRLADLIRMRFSV